MFPKLLRIRNFCAAGGLVALAAGCGGIGQTAAPERSPSPAAAASGNVNLAQCGKSSRVITDANGFQTTIKGTPARLVTTELSFTDDVSLLGVAPVGLGDDGSTDTVIPQIRSRLTRYTSIGTRESPNFAVIAGLKPDLIIADKVGNAKILDQLRSVAPTLALSSQHTAYEQNIDTARTIGAALNQCGRMDKIIAGHNALMARIKAKVPSRDHRTFVFGLGSDKSVTIFNSTQYTGTVLENLGLKAAATDPSMFPAGDASGVSEETLAQLDPQIIFYSNVGDASTSLLDTWTQGSLFRATSAYKSHMVFRVNQKAWSLTRGITGSEVIAQQAVQDLYGK